MRGYDQAAGDSPRALTYLHDLEREGHENACIFSAISSFYKYGYGCDEDMEKALEYDRRAVDLGYPPAYLTLFDTLWYGTSELPKDQHKAMVLLLEAEEKGILGEDERIIGSLISAVGFEDELPPEILGKFKNRAEMILHYCDVLIDRKIPEGYYCKGRVYMDGDDGMPKDKAKAVSIWEEAVRLGLANINVYYSGLQKAYMYVF